MRKSPVDVGLTFVVLLVVSGLALSQGVSQNWTLVVSGQSGQAPVLQADGRSYVETEDLARLSHGSLSFSGNQITLTLPGSGTSKPATAVPSSQPATSEFSKDMKAGIETMTVIREWRGALVNAVKNGYPVTDELMADYRGQTTTNLRLAHVATSTDSDRSASSCSTTR